MIWCAIAVSAGFALLACAGPFERAEVKEYRLDGWLIMDVAASSQLTIVPTNTATTLFSGNNVLASDYFVSPGAFRNAVEQFFVETDRNCIVTRQRELDPPPRQAFDYSCE